MDKRKIMLVALGVTDEWNPLETFKRLLVDVPLARIVGFGIPMELSRDVVKDWDTTGGRSVRCCSRLISRCRTRLRWS